MAASMTLKTELQNARFQITAKIMPRLHFLQQLSVKDHVCVCVCVVISRLGNPFAHGNISPRGIFRREWVKETLAFTEHLS